MSVILAGSVPRKYFGTGLDNVAGRCNNLGMDKYSAANTEWQHGYSDGYHGVMVASFDLEGQDYTAGYHAGSDDYDNDEPDLSGETSFDYVEPEAYQDWEQPEWRPRGDAPMGAG